MYNTVIKILVLASLLAPISFISHARALTCYEEHQKVKQILAVSKITAEGMIAIEAKIAEALAFKQQGDDGRCAMIMRDIFPD